jgi:hypothetical protein
MRQGGGGLFTDICTGKANHDLEGQVSEGRIRDKVAASCPG